MKKILAFTILGLTVWSCKKENIAPLEIGSPDPGSSAHVTTAGSYWVYDWYQVDSVGNETWLSQWKDTIRITGDTTINGNVFQVYKGKHMGANTEYYTRDSSGCILNTDGSIIYSYTSDPMLLTAYGDGYYKHRYFIGAKQTIATAFGSKEASVTYQEIAREDGSPVNNCGDLSVNHYTYYVFGIGCMGMETEYYAMMPQCSKKRSKLSAYYIAP